MHKLARIGATVGLLFLAAAGSVGAAHGVSAKSDIAGHVYVNDNTTGTNTVAAFDRHADGSLTPLDGSPFAVGGAGTGSGVGSQGGLQLSSDGRYLLVADAGSNQISVLRIKPDGSLQQVGSPVWSGGSEPVTIAAHGNLVYVGNAGGSTPNITGFTLNAGGHLRALDGSTVSLPATYVPADVFFNTTGTTLVGTLLGPAFGSQGKIVSYAVGSNGLLVAAPGSPLNAQGAGTIGSEFRPTNPGQLFVSIAHDGKGFGKVSAYSVAGNGALSPIGGSPYANGQTAPCWVEITHDGRYLFAINTASNSISRYTIANDGSLTLPAVTITLNDGPNSHPTDARLDPSGSNLYVVNPGAHAVSAFAVHDGNLTELSSSPVSLPAGAAPFGIAVD